MRLSKTAADYYQLVSNQRVGENGRTLSDDVNRILATMPRSGGRNQAACDVLIKRWQSLVDIRIEVFVEAYELDGHVFEKDDIEEFVDKLHSGSRHMAEGWANQIPGSLSFSKIVEATKSINLNGRLKLFAIMKKYQLKKRLDSGLGQNVHSNISINGPVEGGIQIGGERNLQQVSSKKISRRKR